MNLLGNSLKATLLGLLLPLCSFAEEAATPLLTALQSTTISGYVDVSASWNPGAPVYIHLEKAPRNSPEGPAILGYVNLIGDSTPEELVMGGKFIYIVSTRTIGTLVYRTSTPFLYVDPRWSHFVGGYNEAETGKTILVWQMETGHLQAIVVKGTKVLGTFYPEGKIRGGKAVGVYDFDLDGGADILVQHTNGRLSVRRLMGSKLLAVHYLSAKQKFGEEWRVARIFRKSESSSFFTTQPISSSTEVLGSPGPRR